MARAVGVVGPGLAGNASRAIAAGRPACVRAVVFDMDGTLTEQGALDFGLIRSRIGCPQEAGERMAPAPAAALGNGLRDASSSRAV